MSFINRTYTFTDGTTAYGSQVDSEIANIVNTINSCDTGSTTWDTIKVTTLLPQANIAMGGFKLTGLANGSASTDSVAYGQISGLATAVTGSIIMYVSTTAPSGYLYCNGQAVLRGTYAALFAIIGTSYGSGDGVTSFNVPDFRGYFPRGTSDGSGHDPDASSRTASIAGGSTGDNPGSFQADGFKSHTHTPTDPGHAHTLTDAKGGGAQNPIILNDTGSGGSGSLQRGTAGGGGTNSLTMNNNTTGITIGSTGGNETRPANLNVTFMIKT